MTKAAWIGLGTMGAPMAGHLRERGGYQLTVYNRTRAKAAAWSSARPGTAVAGTPAEAAMGASLVFACVGNDDDLREVTIGPNGAFQAMAPGSMFVDHSTTSAEVARELDATARSIGLHFLDAPVSGGQSGAENGTLTVMVGGSVEAFETARPAIMSYARHVNLLGPSGSGQLTKMVNQICIAGLVQGLAEGLHFAQKAGLDPKLVQDTLSKGAAQSWQMDNRWMTMAAGQFEFGFAVDWMRKDLAICFAEAERQGATIDVARLVDTYYAEVQALGGRRWDTSSLIARLTRPS